jgi:radical SAM protein with 4Fe4S-binding SPASM domain
MKYRYENFGGIISNEAPPFLAFVDRQYMKELGLSGSEKWADADESIGLLSAPTEVHFAVTNRCSVRCPHCYMEGGMNDQGELDLQAMKRAFDVLSRMQVFHVAMGGGEATERNDLFEIAHYAREAGLVPNLTISGVGLTKELVKKLRVFGQVNISIDGTEEDYAVFRGKNYFEEVDRSIDLLTAEQIPKGINCVLGKNNFKGIEGLFQYAAKKQLDEIEFLRFKPAGRGKATYLENKTTYEQNVMLPGLLARLSGKTKITAKIDCSFVPMMCYYHPSVEMLHSMGTYGCEAGNVLLGIRSNGKVSGCSFLETTTLSVFDLEKEYAENPALFSAYRKWTDQAVEPCKSCTYLHLCKGGCHAVSMFELHDYHKPDPDCPFVVDYFRDRQKTSSKNNCVIPNRNRFATMNHLIQPV